MSKGIESQTLIIIGALIAIVFIFLFASGFLQKLTDFFVAAMAIMATMMIKAITSLLNPFG